jgi:stage III sporulation protein AC
MEPLLILRIALVGILVSIINQLLKQSGRDELAFLASLTGLIVVLLWLLPYITDLFLTIQQLFNIV